jgi:hypothetical protein
MKFTHIPFLSLRRKTLSLLFMLRKERSPFYGKSIVILLPTDFPDKIVFPKGLLHASAHSHSTGYCRRFALCSIFAIDAI